MLLFIRNARRGVTRYIRHFVWMEKILILLKMAKLLPVEWEDTIEEVHRLQQKATSARSVDNAREYAAEADTLSQTIAQFLRRRYPNSFNVYFVQLTENEFSAFTSPLTWTDKSLARIPRRRQLVEMIKNTHQLEAYDIVILHYIRGPIPHYSVLFIKPDGIEGSITSNVLIIPKSLSELVHDLGLTDLAAQELYFGYDPSQWQAWLFIKPLSMEGKEIAEEENVKII